MSGATELLTLRADMKDLRGELAKLPGITDKEAKAMVRSLERQLKRTEKAAAKSAKKTSNSFDDMGKSAKRASRQFRAVGGAASVISPELGALVTDAGALAKGFAALANPAGMSALAVAAVGAAAVGAVVGMVAITNAAAGYLTELQAIQGHPDFPGVSPEVQSSIEGARAAMGALNTVFKQAVVVLGGEFAPYVQEGARLLVALSLAGLDAFQSFAAGHDVVREFAVFLAQEFIQTLAIPIDGMVDMIGMMGRVANAVGATGIGEALTGLQDQWEGFTRGLAESAIDVVFEKGAFAVDGLRASLGEYYVQAGEVIEISAELAAGQQEVAEKVELNTAAMDKQHAAIRRGIEEMQASAASMEGLQAELDAAFEEALRDARRTITSSSAMLFGGIQDMASVANDILIQETGKSSKALFAINKGAGIAQATINTFLGATQALGSLPPPASFIAAGAVTAAGLASIAKIASTPPPKKMGHSGMIAPSTALAPDEFVTPSNTRALRTEVIFDSATISRDMADGVRSAMMGGGMRPTVVVGDSYKHLDRRAEDLLLGDSRTARQLERGRGRTGKRQR
ncbi:MAG: hypothetical protein AAFV53_03010 [Myxococcota bacterium]